MWIDIFAVPQVSSDHSGFVQEVRGGAGRGLGEGGVGAIAGAGLGPGRKAEPSG